MGVDEAAVRAAVKQRRQYILDHVNTITLKSCRQTLEEDMGLESGALKPFKQLLSTLIDKLMAKHKVAQAEAREEAPAAEEEERLAVSSGKKQRKKAKANGDEGAKPSKRQKQEEKPAKPSGPRQYSRKVEKLRSICKAATVTIPPNLYVKNKQDAELQAALETLLEKHGLDANSGEREITKAKAELQIQRDLDGIDSSNIIQGGRPRRNAAAAVSYKSMVDPASDDDESEEDDYDGKEEGEEEAHSDDDDAAAGSAKKQQTKAKAAKPSPGAAQRKAKPAASESESEAASSSGEEEEVPTKPAAAKSPDENQAARGNGDRVGQKTADRGSKPASKARTASSLEDSDNEQPVAAGKRRALADWSDEEED